MIGFVLSLEQKSRNPKRAQLPDMREVESKRIGQRVTMVVLIHQEGKELRKNCIAPQDPMSAAMDEKGKITHRDFEELMCALTASDEDEFLSRIHKDEIPGISPPLDAVMASPRRRGESEHQI